MGQKCSQPPGCNGSQTQCKHLCNRREGDLMGGGLNEYSPSDQREAKKELVEARTHLLGTGKTQAEKHQMESSCSGTEDDTEDEDSDVSHHREVGGDQSYFHRELAELEKLNFPVTNEVVARPKHIFSTGASYHGQWKGNARHGFGVMEWPDGATFRGQWDNNVVSGNGEFLHADGDTFVGQWKNDVAQGYGVCLQPSSKTKYWGQWVDDIQDGHGEEVREGGGKYVGQFKDGRKHGHGTYEWRDGTSYAGEWLDNSINGHGFYHCKDGRLFRGQWKDAVFQGYGQYEWPDGRSYRGQYETGQKQGFGIFTWADGRYFQGFWCKGKLHGQGRISVAGQSDFEPGEWQMGQQVWPTT